MVFDELRETTDRVITKNMLLLIRLPLLQAPRHCELLEKLYDGYIKVKQGEKQKTIFYACLDGVSILTQALWMIFTLAILFYS
jgi:hypothetical protein